MSRFVLSVLVVAVVALQFCGVADCREACGANQVWDECGSACPPTCEQPGLRRCTKQCHIGCRCVKGFYTQSDGSCIEPSNCP